MSHPKDILAALPDAIRLAGGDRVHAPHPLAENLTLQDGAAAAFRTTTARRLEHPGYEAVRGMRTIEFSRAVTDGLRPFVNQAFEYVASHRHFCAHQVLKNFYPEPVPAYDVSIRPLPLGEGAEILAGRVVVAPGIPAVQVVRYARNVQFPREQILNDEYKLLQATATAVGATGARLEAELVVAALGTNPTLDDAAPLFHVDRGNLIESALDATTLAQAMAALQTQQLASGQYAGLSLAHLVVEPGLEFAARKLVRDAGLDAVRVTPLAGLPSGRWFGLADPLVAPTVVVVQLAKTPNVPIRLEPLATALEFDAASMRIGGEFGAALISYVGIVRGGV